MLVTQTSAFAAFWLLFVQVTVWIRLGYRNKTQQAYCYLIL